MTHPPPSVGRSVGGGGLGVSVGVSEAVALGEGVADGSVVAEAVGSLGKVADGSGLPSRVAVTPGGSGSGTKPSGMPGS